MQIRDRSRAKRRTEMIDRIDDMIRELAVNFKNLSAKEKYRLERLREMRKMQERMLNKATEYLNTTHRKKMETKERRRMEAESDEEPTDRVQLKRPIPRVNINRNLPANEPPGEDEPVKQSFYAERLTAKQFEAARMMTLSPARHVCLVGGARSGKTVLLTRAVFGRAVLTPGSVHAILRFRAVATWPSVGLQTIPFVLNTYFPWLEVKQYTGDHMIELPRNGSQIWLGGLDDKERAEKILGREYLTIYYNECSQIPYSSVLLGLSRLAQNIPGGRQRALYDLNPGPMGHWSNQLFGRKIDPVTHAPLPTPGNYERMFLNPKDNAENLTPEYLEELQGLPEKARRRFWDGIYQDETADSLWTQRIIEDQRIESNQLPKLIKIMVAVDPSGAESELDTKHDAIGIMVVALGVDGHGYVLADLTLHGSPEQWGKAAVAAYHFYKANGIIGEINYGGAMIEYVIRSIDKSVPFVSVTASRGKTVRAQPIAALYSRGMVHHVGFFPELEDELYAFTDFGYAGERSPNRADSLVWGFTNLMLEENEAGWVQWYNTKVAESQKKPDIPGKPEEPTLPATTLLPLARFQAPQPPPPASHIRFQAPSPHAAFYVAGSDGTPKRFVADEFGVIDAEVVYGVSLENAGCRRME